MKPFAYSDPERIVMFQKTFRQGRLARLAGTASPTEFNWWRQQTTAFQDVSAYSLFDVANFTGEAFPEQIRAMRVSADFFRLCGATALHGRTFSVEDDLPNAPKTVVLAYAFWQRRFASDPRVIGRRITLNGERHEIIGVAESNLKNGQVSEMMLGTGDITIVEPPDVYIPFQLDPNSAEHGHYFNVAGRLKAGVTLAEANARLQASYSEYGRKWPDDVSEGAGFRVQPLQDAIAGGVRSSLRILLGVVLTIFGCSALLLAAIGIYGVMAYSVAQGAQEIGIRRALGAESSHIRRMVVSQGLRPVLAGVVCGLGAAFGLTRLIAGFLFGVTQWDPLVFFVVPAILIGIALVAVWLPTMRASRVDPVHALRYE